MEDIRIKQVPIEELKFSEYNPRQANEQQFEDLKRSILSFGIVDPIIVNSAPNRRNIIIGGHFRVNICKQLGIKTIPVVYVNIPNLEKEQELNLRLNKNLGQWDYDLLANFNEELLKDIGFESQELDKIFQLDTPPEADDVPEVRKKVSIKRGDLFKLSNHRLLCGDATKKEDVEKLMNGKKADMVFTDPPYGINLDTDYSQMGKMTTKYAKVKGDDIDFDAKFIFEIPAKSYWLWGADYYSHTIPIYKEGSYIVWAKAHSEEENKVWTNRFELVWVFPKRKKVIWFERSIQHQHSERIGHPTQKPISVCVRGINEATDRDNVVLDLFGGSGSTLIACEQLNRICYMMEIDPIYCDVIIRRWENFTGQKAVKING